MKLFSYQYLLYNLVLLTPEGVLKKSRLAVDFLGRKKQEFNQIKLQIETLSKELNDSKLLQGKLNIYMKPMNKKNINYEQ